MANKNYSGLFKNCLHFTASCLSGTKTHSVLMYSIQERVNITAYINTNKNSSTRQVKT